MSPRRPQRTSIADNQQNQPTDPLPPCLRTHADGVVLDVSVAPGAKRTEIVGLHDGALRLRLAAQPVEGQANAALIRWLATELNTPRNSIELLRGDSSRRKQVQISVPPHQVLAWLKSQLA
jgi:uncharacterized protein (TIGR00251 family)